MRGAALQCDAQPHGAQKQFKAKMDSLFSFANYGAIHCYALRQTAKRYDDMHCGALQNATMLCGA